MELRGISCIELEKTKSKRISCVVSRSFGQRIEKYKEFPILAFPQYQIFTPDRYQIKTRICLAFNKKKFPNIKLNGGGDLTLATLNNELVDPKKVPNINVPIYQYDSIFRTKEIISEDRARFARAWIDYIGADESRGGKTQDLALKAW